jgi:hypothetical protein
MIIVTYRHRPRKRPAKAVPAGDPGRRIAAAKRPAKRRTPAREPIDDPEADTRVVGSPNG